MVRRTVIVVIATLVGIGCSKPEKVVTPEKEPAPAAKPGVPVDKAATESARKPLEPKAVEAPRAVEASKVEAPKAAEAVKAPTAEAKTAEAKPADVGAEMADAKPAEAVAETAKPAETAKSDEKTPAAPELSKEQQTVEMLSLAVASGCLGKVYEADAERVAPAISGLLAKAKLTKEQYSASLRMHMRDQSFARAVDFGRTKCPDAKSEPRRAVKVTGPARKALSALTSTVCTGKRPEVTSGDVEVVTDLVQKDEQLVRAFMSATLGCLEKAPGGPAGPTTPMAPVQDKPCAKDADCSGDDLCVDGKCVAPPKKAKGDPPPPPPVAKPADPPPPPPVAKPADPPPPPPPAPAGCQKDTDCKGDRICDSGQCVTPKTAPVPPPPAKPVVVKRKCSGKRISFTVQNGRARGGVFKVLAARMKFSGSGKGRVVWTAKGGGGKVKVSGTIKKNSASGTYTGRLRNKAVNGAWSAKCRTITK